MASFISISGASRTGKTSLVESLSVYPELSDAVFAPDLFNTVWSDLVDQGVFSSYDEIVRDSEYICIYLIKVIDYYDAYLESFRDTDKLVILDCCYIDMLVYGLINMWATRTIKDLQVEILGRIIKLYDTVDRIYITQFDKSKQETKAYRSEFKIYSLKDNRSLELEYYRMIKAFARVKMLPTSDQTDSALFIIEDLRNSGYLSTPSRY